MNVRGKEHLTAVRKSTRTIKKTQRVLESADSSLDEVPENPPKKPRTNSKPRHRKIDYCKNGEPFKCSICDSPYINTSSGKSKCKLQKYPIEKERNGDVLQLCVKCSSALTNLENKGPSPEEREEFEEEGRQFAEHWSKLLKEPDVSRLYCSLYQSSKCGCIQNYVNGTLTSSRKRKTSQTFSDSSQCELSDTVSGNTDNLPSEQSDPTAKVMFLLSLLKESKTKRKELKLKRKQSGEELTNLNKSLDSFILSNRVKLKYLGICERGCQKVLCYSNNFLHKKPASSEARLKRTKGSFRVGNVLDLKDLHKQKCCEKNCCKMASGNVNQLKDWRDQAQVSQKDMWKVITEMFGLSGSGCKTACCPKFIRMVTGCCNSTVHKVFYNFRLSKGDVSKPEHGMKFHWKKQKEENKLNVEAVSQSNPTVVFSDPQFETQVVLSNQDALATKPHEQYPSSAKTSLATRNHQLSAPVGLPVVQPGSIKGGHPVSPAVVAADDKSDIEQKIKKEIPQLCINLDNPQSNLKLLELVNGLIEIQKHKEAQQISQPVISPATSSPATSFTTTDSGHLQVNSKTPEPIFSESLPTTAHGSFLGKTVTLVSSPVSHTTCTDPLTTVNVRNLQTSVAPSTNTSVDDGAPSASLKNAVHIQQRILSHQQVSSNPTAPLVCLTSGVQVGANPTTIIPHQFPTNNISSSNHNKLNSQTSLPIISPSVQQAATSSAAACESPSHALLPMTATKTQPNFQTLPITLNYAPSTTGLNLHPQLDNTYSPSSALIIQKTPVEMSLNPASKIVSHPYQLLISSATDTPTVPTDLPLFSGAQREQVDKFQSITSTPVSFTALDTLSSKAAGSSCEDRSLQHSTLINSISNVNMSQSQSRRAIHFSKNSSEPGHHNSSQFNVASVVHSTQTPQVFESQVSTSLLQSPLSFLSKQPLSSSLASSPQGNVTSSIKTPSSCSSGSFVFDALADSPIKDVNLQVSPQTSAKSSLLCEMLLSSSSLPLSGISSDHHSSLPFSGMSNSNHYTNPAAIVSLESHCSFAPKPIPISNANLRLASLESCPPSSSNNLTAERFLGTSNTQITSHIDVSTHQPSLKVSRVQRTRDPPQVGIVNPYISSSLKPESSSNQSTLLSEHLALALPTMATFIRDNTNQDTEVRRLDQFISLSTSLDQSIVQHLVSNEPIYTGQLSTQTNHVNQRTLLDDLNQANAVTVVNQSDNSSTSVTNSEKTHALPCFTQLRYGLPSGQNNPVVSNILVSSYPSHLVSSAPSNSCLTQTVSSVVSSASSSSPLIVQTIICQDTGQIKLLPLLITREQCPSTSVFASDTHSTNQIVLSRPNPGSSSASVLATAGQTVLPSSQTQTVLHRKNDLPNVTSTFALGDNSNLPLVLNSGPMKNSLLPQTKTPLGSSSIGQAIYLSGHSDNQNLFSQQDNGSTNVIFNLGQDLQAVQNAGQSSGQTLNHFKMDSLNNLNSSRGHSILTKASLISSLSQQLTNSVDTISASSVNNPGGQHRPLRPKPESSLQQMVRSKSDVQQMVRSEPSVQQVVRPESSEQLAVRPDSGAPNVINPKPGQNCTFLLVPDQPNYPTYQIALCPNTQLDSQIGVSVPEQPGICREQTTSLLPIQIQGLGSGLNSCIPQWSTPVSQTETISQHSVVVSIQSLPNTSGPTSAVYTTAPPSQPDLSQMGLPSRVSTFDPQRSPVTMSANQTAGVAQPKSYLSITPEAKQSQQSEKSVSSTHNSHHIPHSNMYIKGNSEALSLAGINQEPPNGIARNNTQIGPSTSSKVSVLLNTPPNLTNKPGEITFLRNKEVIDLTEDSPPLTPASKHDATISLKHNSHHLEPTRLSENLLSPNPQTGQSQMNETLLNYTENTPNDPMSSQLFNIRQSAQNDAQEMPNVQILVIAQPGSTPMTFSTTRLATQELTDTPSEVFLSLSPQVRQWSQGAQDQIYLAPANIIGLKAGRNMVSHTNDQMSLPAGHLSAPPVSSAPVELTTPGHLSSQASRSEMEWVNRLAVTSSPSSKLFLAPSSSPQSTSHSSCKPISPLSSYVVFTRATNTPMDAVGPPNITVMSPSRISARLRSESSFLPTAAMVNVATPPLITNTKSGVSKQAVTANTMSYVPPPVTTSILTYVRTPPVTTSTLSYVSIPSVTTSTLSYVRTPPVTTSTLSYVRTPPVTTGILSYVSTTPVTTSTLSSLKTPSLTPKPSTQNTAQQVFHPTLVNNLPCPKTCVTLSQSTDRTSSLSVIPVCESYTVPQALSNTRAPKPRKKPSTVLELLKNKESMQNTSLQASTTSISTMPLLQPVGQMASSVIFQGNLVNQSASVQPTALTVQLKNAPHGSAGLSSEKNLSLKGTSNVLVLHAEKPQLRDTCDSQQHHAYTANIPPARLQMVTQSPAQQQVSIGHNTSPGTSVLPKLASLSVLPNSGAQKIAVTKTPVLIAEPKLKFVTQPLGSSPLTFLPKSTAPGLTIVSCKPSSESAPKSVTEGKASSEERVMLSKLDTKQTDLSSEMLQFVKSKQIASTNFSVPASSGTGTSLKLKLPSQQLNSENRPLSESREQKNLLSSISVGQLDRSVLSSSVASESIRRQNTQIPEQMQIQKLFLRPGQPVLTCSNPILSNILFSHSVSEPSQVYHSTSAPRGSSGNPSELNNPEMTDQRDLIQANLSPPQTSSQNDIAVRPFKTMGSAPVSVTQLQDETPRNSFDQPSKYFTLSKTGPSTIFTSEQLSDLQHPSSEAIITKHSSGGQFIVSSDGDHAKNESFKNGRIGKIIDDIYNRGDDIDETSVVISSQFFTRNPQTSSINTAFQVANKQTTIAQNTALISRSECVEPSQNSSSKTNHKDLSWKSPKKIKSRKAVQRISKKTVKFSDQIGKSSVMEYSTPSGSSQALQNENPPSPPNLVDHPLPSREVFVGATHQHHTESKLKALLSSNAGDFEHSGSSGAPVTAASSQSPASHQLLHEYDEQLGHPRYQIIQRRSASGSSHSFAIQSSPEFLQHSGLPDVAMTGGDQAGDISNNMLQPNEYLLMSKQVRLGPDKVYPVLQNSLQTCNQPYPDDTESLHSSFDILSQKGYSKLSNTRKTQNADDQCSGSAEEKFMKRDKFSESVLLCSPQLDFWPRRIESGHTGSDVHSSIQVTSSSPSDSVLASSYKLAQQMSHGASLSSKESFDFKESESSHSLSRTDYSHHLKGDKSEYNQKKMDHFSKKETPLPNELFGLHSPIFSDPYVDANLMEPIVAESSSVLESLSTLKKDICEKKQENRQLKKKIARIQQKQKSGSDLNSTSVELYNDKRFIALDFEHQTDGESVKKLYSSGNVTSKLPELGRPLGQRSRETGQSYQLYTPIDPEATFPEENYGGGSMLSFRSGVQFSDRQESPELCVKGKDPLVSSSSLGRPPSQLELEFMQQEHHIRQRYPSSEFKSTLFRSEPDSIMALLERHRNPSSSQRSSDLDLYDMTLRHRNPSTSSLKSGHADFELLNLELGTRSRHASINSYLIEPFAVRSRNPSGSSNRRSRPGSSSSDREFPGMDDLSFFPDIARTRSRNSSGESLEPTVEPIDHNTMQLYGPQSKH